MEETPNYAPLIVAAAIPHIGGVCGLMLTSSQISWYESLNKPNWRPPNWMLAPIWTGLYTGMGVASYLVWRDGNGFAGDAKLPLLVYGVNLALNWAWAPIFFGSHKLGLALGDAAFLWGTVGICSVLFWPVNHTASYLMLPYWAWITLAASVNFYIWKENTEDKEE